MINVSEQKSEQENKKIIKINPELFGRGRKKTKNVTLKIKNDKQPKKLIHNKTIKQSLKKHIQRIKENEIVLKQEQYNTLSNNGISNTNDINTDKMKDVTEYLSKITTNYQKKNR